MVTTTISGGFNSTISLSASGFPSGVSGSFSPSSIAAPSSGTAHFNITVRYYAQRGTYPLTIKASGGGQTQTTVLTVQVR